MLLQTNIDVFSYQVDLFHCGVSGPYFNKGERKRKRK